jgi:arsenate reductase
MIKIYHNPRCSKSRAALARVEQFAQQQRIPVEVVDYLRQPPTVEQLAQLQRQLATEARVMVRDNEDAFAELQLDQADESELLAAIARHPLLLQRPIVVYRDRALIARPPELLEQFLVA